MVIFVFCAFAYNEYIYYYYYIMYIIFKPTIFSHFLPQKVKQDYEVQKISFCRGTRLQKIQKTLQCIRDGPQVSMD